ncbi:MAG: aminoacyl-tRNA hydrolase, partial [Ornithinimicrobium sp.]
MEPWLVIGLGNPGPTYAEHRHNVGAMVIAAMARDAGTKLTTHKARAHAAQIRLGTLPGGLPGPPVIVAQPQTFMNLSGGPVAGLATFFSFPLERIVVVHD